MEKGPTAVHIGKGTEPLYSFFFQVLWGFFQRAHDLLRRWKKRGRAGERGDWIGERVRVVAFQLSLQAQ